MRSIMIYCAALVLGASPATGQSLLARITGAPPGEVRISFASRPDVCGDGENTIRHGKGRRTVTGDVDRDDKWGRDCPCQEGPVRVALTVRDREVTKIRVRVGGQWRSGGQSVTDLGTVSAKDAATALLAIAGDPRHLGGDDAVFPATLADSVTIWPQLLRLARDDRARRDTRRQAVFWLSQAAGDSATAGLSELAESETEDQEIRTQAVFGLSQRPKDEGVPALIRIARSNRDPEVRRSAIFWLGQADDPRALALFEELLVR